MESESTHAWFLGYNFVYQEGVDWVLGSDNTLKGVMRCGDLDCVGDIAVKPWKVLRGNKVEYSTLEKETVTKHGNIITTTEEYYSYSMGNQEQHNKWKLEKNQIQQRVTKYNNTSGRQEVKMNSTNIHDIVDLVADTLRTQMEHFGLDLYREPNQWQEIAINSPTSIYHDKLTLHITNQTIKITEHQEQFINGGYGGGVGKTWIDYYIIPKINLTFTYIYEYDKLKTRYYDRWISQTTTPTITIT